LVECRLSAAKTWTHWAQSLVLLLLLLLPLLLLLLLLLLPLPSSHAAWS
jgi:hypothetical protein